MKTVLLIIFLLLSLVLPLSLALFNKRRGMVASMAIGAAIYVAATVITNFLSLATKLEGLESFEDRQAYTVFVTLALLFAVWLFSRFKGFYDDKNKSDLIYSGFSLVNLFINNMNSYSFLLFIAMNNDVETLSAIYQAETAKELVTYFESINTGDIALMIVEMILVFLIMKYFFNAICQKDRKMVDYFTFLIGLFVLYFAQYCINNLVVSFVIYILLLIFGYRSKISNLFKKRKADAK